MNGIDTAATGGRVEDIARWRAMAACRALAGERMEPIVRVLRGRERMTSEQIAIITGHDWRRTRADLEVLYANGLVDREELEQRDCILYLYTLSKAGWDDLAAGISAMRAA